MCIIVEGQFKNGKRDGFIRSVKADKQQDLIGFWKQDSVHGYFKQFLNGTTTEGLFINDIYIKNKEEIPKSHYDTQKDFIAQYVIWDEYMTKKVPEITAWKNM